MKRLLPRFGLALVFACTAFALFLWFFGPEERISQAACNRIQPGMSEAQIEELLGGPGVTPIWPDEKSVSIFWKSITGHAAPAGARHTSWRGEESEINVLFDRENRVIEAHFWTVINVDDTWFKKIRRRLGI